MTFPNSSWKAPWKITSLECSRRKLAKVTPCHSMRPHAMIQSHVCGLNRWDVIAWLALTCVIKYTVKVFDGTSTVNDTLQRGCQSTRSLILVDRLGRAATTAFHSNCGGKTWAGSDVWSDQLPYLQSVDDAACADAPHARWSQTVPRQEWDEFWSLHEADSMQGLLTARKRYGWPSASFQFNPDSLRPDVYKVVVGSGFWPRSRTVSRGSNATGLILVQTAWEILRTLL